jgi:glycosyltransferase involved in cell wall biosynthesis
MIKACFLIKYPPIEGGVSVRGYWTAREMAERGHHIFVITNANEVEDDYRIYMDEDDRDWYEPSFEDTGGFVKVRHTQPFSDAMMHIPEANPFVAKLASVATQVIRKHGCDVIYAHYLQPYGLAAYLASQWTGVPYIVKHAGSDLGRLMKQRDLTTAYREVLKAADCVWSGLSEKEPFLAMGVREERLWINRAAKLPDIFNNQGSQLDLNGFLAKLATIHSDHVKNVLINTGEIDFSKPTIGIYGKVGEIKGSFDLLAALGILKGQGLNFNFLALTQGKGLENFKRAIREHDLQDRAWTFPFIPHWKVPGFIRACTAVCFLERDFPIGFHGPTVPKEVFACGTCLIVSEEIAEKQPRIKERFVDRENVLIADDPKDHTDLARQLRFVIEDPERARRIGEEGHRLFREFEVLTPFRDRPLKTYVEGFEEKLMEIREKRKLDRLESPDSREKLESLRRERLKARLPYTSALLAGRWNELVSRYCNDQRTIPENQFIDATRLCAFLESSAGVQASDGNHLPDVLKYERTRNSLFADINGGPAALTPSGDERIKAPFGGISRKQQTRRVPAGIVRKRFDDVRSLKPVRARGVHVESFGCDLRRLLSYMRQGKALDEVQSEKTFVLFKKELNFVNLELQISEATKNLIELCDGDHTIEAIIADVDRSQYPKPELDRDSMKNDVLESIRELYAKGVIRSSDG